MNDTVSLIKWFSPERLPKQFMTFPRLKLLVSTNRDFQLKSCKFLTQNDSIIGFFSVDSTQIIFHKHIFQFPGKALRENSPYLELFWSSFSRIWTEYEDILRISPYSG